MYISKEHIDVIHDEPCLVLDRHIKTSLKKTYLLEMFSSKHWAKIEQLQTKLVFASVFKITAFYYKN